MLFYLHALSAGGAERVVAQLAGHWDQHGCSVAIATRTARTADFYRVAPSIRRIELESDGSTDRGLWPNLRRIAALRRTLVRERPDVVISMMDASNVLLAAAGAGLRDIVRVGSERVHPPMNPLNRPWDALRRIAYPRLDAIVAPTRTTADWLLQHVPGSRVEVIPNPVMLPLPPATDPLPVGGVARPGRPFLLAAGRLESQKGFDLLLRAFAAVAADHPRWDVIVLGRGGEERALRALAAELGIADRVLLPGTAGNIGDWYAAAAAFALPSRFEGFPNALLEAMAHGCAVVAADCPAGPQDMIRPGIDGLLVPPESPQALAGALAALFASDALRASLGLRAREVVERYALPAVAAQWEALFDRVRRR